MVWKVRLSLVLEILRLKLANSSVVCKARLSFRIRIKKGNSFLKEINGFMLSATDQCQFDFSRPDARKRAFLLSGTLYVYS